MVKTIEDLIALAREKGTEILGEEVMSFVKYGGSLDALTEHPTMGEELKDVCASGYTENEPIIWSKCAFCGRSHAAQFIGELNDKIMTCKAAAPPDKLGSINEWENKDTLPTSPGAEMNAVFSEGYAGY